MNMRKNICGLLVLMLVGCTQANVPSHKIEETVNQSNKYYDAYASIPSEDIQQGETMAELAVNFNDPTVVYNESENIAIIRITSIDKGTAFDPQTQEPLFITTLGQFEVLQNLKGELPLNTTLDYRRLGGIVAYDEYFASLDESQQNKIKYLRGNQQAPKYVKDKFEGDIDVEVGKTYLAYLVPYHNAYEMIGFEGGLREVDIQANKMNRSAENEMTIKVMNNLTHQWEDLSNIIHN